MQAVIHHLFWNRSRDCSVYTTSKDGVLRRTPAQMFQCTWFMFCLFGVEGVKRTAKSSLPLFIGQVVLRQLYSSSDRHLFKKKLSICFGYQSSVWYCSKNLHSACHNAVFSLDKSQLRKNTDLYKICRWRSKMSHANFKGGFWNLKKWIKRRVLLPILCQMTF